MVLGGDNKKLRVRPCELSEQDAAESFQSHLGFFDLPFSGCFIQSVISVVTCCEASFSVDQQLVFCKSCFL